MYSYIIYLIKHRVYVATQACGPTSSGDIPCGFFFCKKLRGQVETLDPWVDSRDIREKGQSLNQLEVRKGCYLARSDAIRSVPDKDANNQI